MESIGTWCSVGREFANEKTLAFVTGYLVEKSLAVDNVFVWMMIFSFFAVPLELQRRVLLYGIIGTKMLIVDWIKIPVLVSLSVVATILACSVFASLWYAARKAKPLA